MTFSWRCPDWGCIPDVPRRRRERFAFCDWGSTHIRYHVELLEEEFGRWGATYPGLQPELISDEEIEYDEADMVVAQSTFAYNSFLSRGYPERKLAWISPGVDTETFFPSLKEDDVFRVLFLGQIGIRKGVGYLLDAALSFSGPGTEVVLAGTIMPEAISLLRRYRGPVPLICRKPRR